MGALGGLAGGKATKSAAGRSAKPAGLALLAGAAGLALKNRDKLKQMAGRSRSTSEPHGTTDSSYQGTANSTANGPYQGTAPDA